MLANFRLRLKKLAKRLLFTSIALAVSLVTPVFAYVLGSLLAVVGAVYGYDWSHWRQPDTPNAYVILGGGLTQTQTEPKPLIILNSYSHYRTERLWQVWQSEPLPIVSSGVESPWIMAGLAHFAKDGEHKPAVISENASMNTCENARFSAKLIAHETTNGNLAPTHHIYLVSDWYHMARARRQFAKAGLATTPIIAPMPEPLSWQNPKSNLNHARRAFYETLALIRDIVRPQTDCRNADDISIDTLKTPKTTPKTFASR